MPPKAPPNTSWVMPNRVGFMDWAYGVFNEGRYAHNARDGKFIQQRVVRDLLQRRSPYRGLLLYHGLGSGKTCTAISVTDPVAFSGRKVVIMLPASLATNFVNELKNCGNLARWSCVELDTDDAGDADDWASLKRAFHFGADFVRRSCTPNKAVPNELRVWVPWVPLVDDPKAVDERGKRPLVLPADRFAPYQKRYKDLAEDDKVAVDKTVDHILPGIYPFIKYNGLKTADLAKYTSRFFENATVVIDEAHNFISQATHVHTLNHRLYENIKAARGVRVVLLSGTPVIGHPIELAYALNLLRGDMRTLEVTLPKSDAPFPAVPAVRAMLAARRLNGRPLGDYMDDVRIVAAHRRVLLTLVPHGFAWGTTVPPAPPQLVSQPWGMSVDQFEKRIVEIFPGATSRILHHDAFPTDRDAFNTLFLDTQDPMRPRVKNEDLFIRRALGLVSYLRNTDVGAANGVPVYPEVKPIRVVDVPMTNHQFEAYEKYRNKELEMEQAQARRKARMGAGGDDPFNKPASVYRAFSRMSCNFAFPKEVARPFPTDMRLARMQMDVDGDEVDGDVDVGDPEAVKKAAKKADADAYEIALLASLKTVADRGDRYLTEEAMHEMYAPKMAAALRDIHDSPGKTLFYSQFRTVEGIGMFRLALAQAGWKEVSVIKTKSGTWRLINGADVMAAANAGKRFVVLDSDRERTEVLMRVFNGSFGGSKGIPSSLQRELAKYGYSTMADNYYGEQVSLVMISQSGAEGISLKHVRRVLVMEPFWNDVRIEQVVGRAARAYSHVELTDPAERVVEVFLYNSVFTKEQVEKSFTIQTHDLGVTSDTYVLNVAKRKTDIIGHFLSWIQRGAVDCRILARNNRARTSASGACYAFPTNRRGDDMAFASAIDEDAAVQERLDRRTDARQIQGEVVRWQGDAKKYVRVDGRIYDYDAYVHAGVLVPK